MTALAWSAAGLWLAALLAPWRPWSTRERLEPESDSAGQPARVTALIPARDEAASIEATLRALLAQPEIERVVVVDDGSEDGTGEIARAFERVQVIDGRPTPAGWSGKLWAQQQGLERIDGEHVLLLDADIELAPGMLAALIDKLERDDLDQVSIMASLPAESLPERLMLPAFVYFFRQLYPFAWVNRADRPLAAAAGGCVLVRRRALRTAGAFADWKNTLIDDCELARRVQDSGGGIWLGLSHGVTSLRRHPDFGSVLDTISRTAYTQLRHSPLLLALTVLVMLLAFAVPPLAVAFGVAGGQDSAVLAGASGWLLMAAGYLPQVRFSRLNPLWALSLAPAAMLFLYATLDSAARHHFGTGAGWKGRRYPG